MRNSLYISFLILTTALSANAQIVVGSDAAIESTGNQTIYHVDIPQVALKETQNAWDHYLNKGSKGKASTDSGHHLQLGAVNKNVSPEPFDVHSTLTEGVAGVRLSAWFTKNGMSLLSKESTESQDLALRKYLHDFALEQYRNAVKDELKTETAKLDRLEKSMRGIIKDGEKSGSTINRNERSEERTADAMNTSGEEIELKTESIEGQREMVEATEADPNANKGANKTMDELKDDKKALQKKNESQGRELDGLGKDTREAERNIQAANEQGVATQAQIDAQRSVVAAVQTKLDGIK